MTFDELGIPFPLFAADASTVDDYVGQGTCSLCGERDQHVFTLAYDGALVVRCPVCAIDRHARHPDDPDDPPPACEECGTPFALPPAPILVCYRCFRAGRAVFARHTTEGFLDLDAVRLGYAYGGQGFASEHFATVEVNLRTGAVRPPPTTPYPEHERRVRHFAARIPVDQMIELLRTPLFIGEASWPFHCARPMVFSGDLWRCPSCGGSRPGPDRKE